MADPAPVPAVTRDQVLTRRDAEHLVHRVLTDGVACPSIADETDACETAYAIAEALYGEATVMALLAEAPAATAELVDGIPEHLHVDMESTIHQHMGHDGQSDETNDWVTDLMSALCPLIERALVLAEAPQPKVLAEVPTLPQLVVKASDKSMVLAVDLDVPPGTPVAVVALGPPVPQTPDGEEPTQS